jgi:hypothetical protein
MQNHGLKRIDEAIFRANRQYELVLFDRLPPDQKELLDGLRHDPDLYGILRPCGQSELGIKSVCRDTALLFFTLLEPGPLPGYVKASLAAQCNQEIAELVLDGVLEIERDGTFVSRADAFDLIYEEDRQGAQAGAIARLSREALRYGQSLELGDALRLSARLYFYNRRPASPERRRRFPSPESVAEYLGINPGGKAADLLERHWSKIELEPPFDAWLMWKYRRSRRAAEDSRYGYKLYVSAECDSVREAFDATLAVASALKVPRFKIGKDVYGMLRPDKIVLYFSRLEDLQEAADRLKDRLTGCPAQGVPFTASLSDDGLLSWGTDPPREQQLLEWRERESWRLWLTNRLANALLAGKAAQTRSVEPWQYALERVRLEGVDTQSWTPDQSIWQENADEKKE